MQEAVLITGATGLVGSYLTDLLCSEKRFKVVAFARKRRAELEKMNVKVCLGELSSKEDIAAAFEEQPVAYVVHLAAIRGMKPGYTEQDYSRINVEATRHLLELALEHKVKKFIFCSTVGVYGTIPLTVPADVHTPLCPDNLYHASKAAAEKLVMEYIGKGLNAYVLRPAIIYGREKAGFPAGLINLVKRKLLFLSTAKTRVHLLDAAGFAGLVNHMLKSESLPDQRVYLVADKEPIALSELADMINLSLRGKAYPGYLKVPAFFYGILSGLFKLAGNSLWHTRICLLSGDRCFDVAPTARLLGFSLPDTKKCFCQRMGI